MRVYEYAKEHNTTSKHVLEILQKQGIKLANHMAVLPDEARKILLKKTEQKAAQSTSAKSPSGQSVGANLEIKPAAKKMTKKEKIAAKKQQMEEDRSRFRMNRETVVTQSAVEHITVGHGMNLGQVAELMQKPVNELIFVLLKKGLARNVNHVLQPEELEILGSSFNVLVEHEVKIGVGSDEDAVRAQGQESRLPVVVVMGHVDHGKTTLLDYLRATNVADKEKGGITQHLSAYEVDAGKKKVVFLDTPGHEAFSYMRTRGTRITDIAIIIVAANDGIKPQTVEAIELAKKADVPIVVAINKVDKMSSPDQLDTIRTQLTQYDLTPEEWGGETVCVPISAKTGQGVDTLLEMLGLHAEMLDLKTSVDAPARAFVLESRQLKGHGSVATVICREGTLRCGDFFLSGTATGKVRLLINSAGKQVKEVRPSVPAQVVGFDTVDGLGDHLSVVSRSDYAAAKSNKTPTQRGAQSSGATTTIAQDEDTPVVRLMCKADMQGSCQAVIDAITKMAQNTRNKSIVIDFLGCEVGPITEGDVIRARDTGAHLFGLHVKVERNAQHVAKELGVEIITHSIIYHMFEQIEEMIKQARSKVVHLVASGKAEVLKVFPIKNRRVIAGCIIKEGLIKPGDKVVCIRSREEVGSGIVTSLQRERVEAKEVREGYDCGFLTDGFHGWQPGDRVTIFSHERDEE